MDGGAWRAMVYGVSKSRTRLSGLHVRVRVRVTRTLLPSVWRTGPPKSDLVVGWELWPPPALLLLLLLADQALHRPLLCEFTSLFQSSDVSVSNLNSPWEFPRSRGVRTFTFTAEATGSIPGWGMMIPWSVHRSVFVALWTAAHQAPLSMDSSRQESWNSSPFPTPGGPPNPGIEPMSPALQADSLPSEPLGKPKTHKLHGNDKKKISNNNNSELGTSLVVQWLRLRAPNAGTWIPSLVRELDPTCHN